MAKKEYVYTILKCNGQNLKKMYEEWKEQGAKAERKKMFIKKTDILKIWDEVFEELKQKHGVTKK